MAASSTPSRADAEARLAILRDKPVNTSDNGQNVLVPIYNYLMAIPFDPSDGRIHWFCSRADSVTVDAATFLIRLFAYDSENVKAWKERFETCLAGCSDCVQSFEEAKVTSRHTYFDAFPDETIRLFYASFDKWELSMVIAALSAAGSPIDDIQNQHRTLANVPPAVLYHMLCNLSILRDPQIIAHLRSSSLPDDSLNWPTDPPPPGLLLLMVDESSDLRRWAQFLALKCKVVPIPRDKFVGPFVAVIEMVADALTTQKDSILPNNDANSKLVGPAINRHSFASDRVSLWAGFLSILRLVPVDLLTSNADIKVDLRRVVTGHLHNIGPEFPEILKSFVLLLKRLGSHLWEGEGLKYPEIIFDSIKDNPSFLELLGQTDSNIERPWFFAWYSEYLHTIGGLAAYGDVLAKMVGFMCEELQHERFKDARPAVMCAATRLLTTAINSSRVEEMSNHREATSRILSIHTDVFVAVAFATSHSDSKWQNARSKVREMISTVLVGDVHDIMNAIRSVCKVLAGYSNVSISDLSIQKYLWIKTYKTLQPTDGEGLKMILSVVARVAHLDQLNENPFSPAFHDMKESKEVSKACQGVNRSLSVIYDEFLQAVSRFANDNDTSSVLDLLRTPGVVKNIMLLMFSPVADVQLAAQNLVGQAFDVDVRLDCFRALLENIPDASLEGIFDFLETFIKYAPTVPEACSLSKSLVRCLTDVIDVLCASHDGLLRCPRYLDPEKGVAPAGLLKFWSLMSKSIAVIFKRTPSWSRYFDSEVMIEWMRDALIFGRDMLAQRRVFEAAIVRDEDLGRAPKSVKLFSGTQKMVGDLQEVLPELARWLRLTDEELLHQSFSLLQSLLDCYRETGIPPSPAGIAKLSKHLDGARKGSSQTRLDANRLSQLEESLAAYVEDDIEIVSHTTASQRKSEGQQVTKSDTKGPVDSSKLEHKKKPHEITSSHILHLKALSIQRPAPKKVLPKFNKFDKWPSSLKPGTSAPSRPEKRKDIIARNEGMGRITRVPDSSSESESDHEELPGSLNALGAYQKPLKIKQPTERRQVKMLDYPGHPERPMQDQREEARRTALRLKPNISGLYKTILSWNYDHTGSEPPLSGTKPQHLHVPDYFHDHAHYCQVFEPLLILECWSQIVQSKTQVNDSYRAKISSKQFVDDWLDLEIDIIDSVKKDWYLLETDVVLFRHTDRQNCVLAKVRSYTARPWGIQACVRCYAGANGGDPNLQINSTWRISKVFSLSTIRREYAALMALPYYQYFDTVFRPRLNKVPAAADKDIRRLMVECKVNEPQAVAISSALQTEGFALIQGPPGTGKTSTICGIVDVFLSNRRPPATAVHTGRNSTAMDKAPPKKVLVCAPSNAAIDEVAYRISQISRKFGNHEEPWKVVRVGADKSINVSTREIALDTLIEKKMQSEEGSSTEIGSAIAAAKAELESVRRLVQEKKAEEAAVHDNAARTLAIQNELKDLNSRRKAASQTYDSLKDKQKSYSRTLDATRRKIRSEILLQADVICSTLSGAGQDILEQLDFEMIIIDEASQSIELSSLIPLRHNCKSCIMVGDPQQLPPTVLSQEACRFNYNQSLFVRLQRHRPDVVQLLSVQYRMHPDISRLPSRVFYDGRLVDGPDMAKKTLQPWHSHEKFGTYRFYNVHKGREVSTPSQSLKNVAEAQVAVTLFQRLRREFPAVDFDFRVGVVSMYSAQVTELRRVFLRRFEADIVEKVDFHTVDGFQGQEKDVIILSCVRAGPGLQNVGFLADIRRMNVALTRAKSSLFILGHAATLERSNETWAAIVRDTRSRNVLVDVDPNYFNSQPQSVARVALQVKPAKTTPAQVVPDDLLTPRELKATVNQRLPLTPTIDPRLPRRPDSVKTNTSDELENKGQKRQLDSEDNRQAPSSTSHSGTMTNIQRPPAKRPKQAPNIFIPKFSKQNK